MKILKPGKVEMRKFVCEKCGCVFVAAPDDAYWVDQSVKCPQEGCAASVAWDDGEPYEEPAEGLQTDRERLMQLLQEARTKHLMKEVVDYLIANGVTFREKLP